MQLMKYTTTLNSVEKSLQERRKLALCHVVCEVGSIMIQALQILIDGLGKEGEIGSICIGSNSSSIEIAIGLVGDCIDSLVSELSCKCGHNRSCNLLHLGPSLL